jgi:pimeloyl-ACP methyl ester carboxylesterase
LHIAVGEWAIDALESVGLSSRGVSIGTAEGGAVSRDLASEAVDLGGHGIRIARSGAGEPVLLVHGITTWSFLWRNVAPVLAEHFEVIAVDLLGCGESDKPLDVSYSLEAHADRLAGLIAALGIGPVHFVGHDLGGGMGQILAVRHREQLRDLVMINTVAFDFWPVVPITTLRTPVIRELLMAAVDAGAFELLVRRGVSHKERVTPELMELFLRPLGTPQGRKAFLHFARCLDNRDLVSITDELGRLDLRTLVVRGEADVYLSATISEKLAATIPGCRLVRIPSAGHFIQEDEPQLLASTVAGFLLERA